MNSLQEAEVVPAPFGKGWTATRAGRDTAGPFEEWIGANYSTYAEAEEACRAWNMSRPPTEERP